MRDTILNELSINNVMKHTRYLADELPERYSGNANEQKAAAYLEQALKTAGTPSASFRSRRCKPSGTTSTSCGTRWIWLSS